MIATQQDDYGVVIAGHGSRDPEGVREFERLVEIIKARCGGRRVAHGFLEFARPTINEAVRSSIGAGSQQIADVPGVLLAASHAKNDMPSEVLALQREFPQARLSYGARSICIRWCDSAPRKIIEAESRSMKLVKRSDTCLVVVEPRHHGPGCQLRRVETRADAGGRHGLWSFLRVFSGTAKPLVADGLKLAVQLGFRGSLLRRSCSSRESDQEDLRGG
jgi:precorrin-8X/cobalt-precorrin-8 methylmutase